VSEAAAVLRVFVVHYHGVWLGGSAVVLAATAEEAIEMARTDSQTARFEKVTVEEVGDALTPRVVFNWNGDY
jgi:hypothetical protein